MQSTEKTPDAYVGSLPEDRQEAITKLRKVIKKNLPKGFVEEMNYGMIGYVVPHKLYPAGCVRFKKPEQIPFDLIGELVSKMTPADWINLYELNYIQKKKLG